jgi:uncharacterized protein (DUF488 family)
MHSVVFTIGHSTHALNYFVSLLLQRNITAVCDVRSTPYSRMNPQFNREDLDKALQQSDITYRFFGKELGARSDDPTCYENGRVQYSRLAETGIFQLGIKRVLRGMKEGHRIALMCAEKEPLGCHRTILVARHLATIGVNIQHIQADGTLESHTEAIDRLARMHNLPEQELFRSREELRELACQLQEERIAFRKPTNDATQAARPSR